MKINEFEKAELTGDVTEITDPESAEYFYFCLQGKQNKFMIGLSDILECLKFAEEKGVVPQLPRKWWAFIEGLYPQFIEPVEVPDDENEEF